jgi:hypothetical protein
MRKVVPILGVLLTSGVILVFLFTTGIFQSRTSSPLPEYIIITDVQYGVGSDGWIAVTANNTGIASVTIIKILINNFKQSSVNPSLPITLTPDNGVVLNITMNVTQSGTYKIDLLTSQGNMFSISSQVPAIMRAGVVLYKANVNFETGKINIDIGNSGASNTQIIQVYFGTSTTLQNVTTTQKLPVSLAAGSIVRLTITYTWTAGTTYYFKIIPAAGQQALTFQEQAPTS